MTRRRKALRTYFPDYMTGALFSAMTEAPWAVDGSQLEMDIAYFASYSGDKPATIFVDRLSTNGVADVKKIADILWRLYHKSWTRLYEAYSLDYTPTDNYNILETVQRDQKNDRTINRTSDTTGSVNSTVQSTDKETSSGETTGKSDTKIDTTEDETTTVAYGKVDKVDTETDQYTYGFNSTEKVPTNVAIETSTNTQSGSDTTTRNLVNTVTNGVTTSGITSGTIDTVSNGTNATITGEKTKDDTTDTDTENENSTRNRTGNIGQTSYQDLISQELELRKWNFFRQVFADCDRFLVLSIYDPCLLGSVTTILEEA